MEVFVLNKLGKGAFADVYRIEFNSGSLKYQVALKVIDCRKSPQNRIKDEVTILKSLQHNKIVHYFTAFEHKDNFYILLEYCNGGELNEYLQTRKPDRYLPDKEVLDLAYQIADAIQFLHQNHIIHRDLKTTNIFLSDGNNIKIGDFGISRQLESTIDVANTYTGTPLYMAPEVINHQSYNYKADSWSFGCCLHELMSLHYAFEPGENTRQHILEAKFCPLPKQYGEDLKQLVRGLLQSEQTQRFDMTDVYSFLQGMIENPKQTRHESFDLPELPGRKAVVKALKDFKIKEIQDSSEDDNHHVEGEEYSDDFESSSGSDLDQTLRNTLQPASNSKHLEGDLAFAREISNGLRENLDCLKIDHHSSHSASQQIKDESTGKPNHVRKKKSFLKEIITSRKAATQPVTLYTRGQCVSFKNEEEEEEDISTVEEKCCKEIGEDKYLRAMSLVHVINDDKILESQLKEILGTSNYKKFKNIFRNPQS